MVNSKKIMENWASNYESQTGESFNLRDKYLYLKEVNSIINEVTNLLGDRTNNDYKILDIGCGTGFLIESLSNVFPKIEFSGIDYSENAIKIAKKRKIENASFFLYDATNFLIESIELFDIIISQRFLINLPDNQSQINALLAIPNRLKVGGFAILSEGFLEGLGNLNIKRDILGLKPIEVVWHNVYPSIKEVVGVLSDKFESIVIKEWCSIYMLITRAIYPHLVYPDEPKYDQEIHKFAFNVQESGNYGYYKMIICKK